MNIQEEKRILYQMMADITQERRNLSEERNKLSELYFELKKRLDKLIELETIGLEDISTEGYVDLFNQQQKERETKNIQRELRALTPSENKPNPIEKILPTPKGEASNVMAELDRTKLRKAMEHTLSDIQNPKEPEKIPKKEIENLKENDRKKNKRTNGQVDFKKVVSTIKTVLKENKEPMTLAELHEAVQDKMNRNINHTNFKGNIIFRANKEEKAIVRLGKGRYTHIDHAHTHGAGEEKDAMPSPDQNTKDDTRNDATRPVSEPVASERDDFPNGGINELERIEQNEIHEYEEGSEETAAEQPAEEKTEINS